MNNNNAENEEINIEEKDNYENFDESKFDLFYKYPTFTRDKNRKSLKDEYFTKNIEKNIPFRTRNIENATQEEKTIASDLLSFFDMSDQLNKYHTKEERENFCLNFIKDLAKEHKKNIENHNIGDVRKTIHTLGSVIMTFATFWHLFPPILREGFTSTVSGFIDAINKATELPRKSLYRLGLFSFDLYKLAPAPIVFLIEVTQYLYNKSNKIAIDKINKECGIDLLSMYENRISADNVYFLGKYFGNLVNHLQVNSFSMKADENDKYIFSIQRRYLKHFIKENSVDIMKYLTCPINSPEYLSAKMNIVKKCEKYNNLGRCKEELGLDYTTSSHDKYVIQENNKIKQLDTELENISINLNNLRLNIKDTNLSKEKQNEIEKNVKNLEKDFENKCIEYKKAKEIQITNVLQNKKKEIAEKPEIFYKSQLNGKLPEKNAIIVDDVKITFTPDGDNKVYYYNSVSYETKEIGKNFNKETRTCDAYDYSITDTPIEEFAISVHNKEILPLLEECEKDEIENERRIKKEEEKVKKELENSNKLKNSFRAKKNQEKSLSLSFNNLSKKILDNIKKREDDKKKKMDNFKKIKEKQNSINNQDNFDDNLSITASNFHTSKSSTSAGRTN